jgi:CBS domain-containing protein
MKVREIMTDRPLTCRSETSLAVAARLMREGDCGILPVVDARGTLAGVITDRDICLALARTNRNAINVAVREVMSRKVRSARTDEDVYGALATMKSARVRRLPVCDENGLLAGMLSVEDVVVRGLQGGIDADRIVDALRTMYVRAPVPVQLAPGASDYTPG